MKAKERSLILEIDEKEGKEQRKKIDSLVADSHRIDFATALVPELVYQLFRFGPQSVDPIADHIKCIPLRIAVHNSLCHGNSQYLERLFERQMRTLSIEGAEKSAQQVALGLAYLIAVRNNIHNKLLVSDLIEALQFEIKSKVNST